MTTALASDVEIVGLHHRNLAASPFSIEVYGEPATETDGLLDSIREQGVLVPLVVAPLETGWEILSGHRRWACARILDLDDLPCQIRDLPESDARRQAVLDYNRQRRKTFRQLMREADALETLLAASANNRRRANLRNQTDRRNSDGRTGRTDATIATRIGIGGKDLYRQARAIWNTAQSGDARARSGVDQLDAGTKTIHAAYKDLRRRDRFTAGFRPTPYDVWNFRHDRAYGVPHPGSIPPGIIAHTLHYYTQPGDLVVDPMAGGGTVLDVCEAMGRSCRAYDIQPVRPEVHFHDVNAPFPPEARECQLVFADPPYHTMKAREYAGDGAGEISLADWIAFLQTFARHAFDALRDGGYVALLLANQTEKDLPAGCGYIDHAFLGYQALTAAGFRPERRISCPMDGAYRPQQVRQSRIDGRMLGQVRDLLVMRKPPRSVPDQWSGSPPANS